MVELIDLYKLGQIGFSQFVGELEGAMDAAEFKNKELMEKWYDFWTPLEILRAALGNEVTYEQAATEIEAMQRFLLESRVVEGFLVVRKNPGTLPGAWNPRYRGLYRIPPYREKEVEEGFEDPLLFGDFVGEEGLAPDLATAQRVLDLFAEVEGPHALEILYARTCERGAKSSELPPESQFLGFDIACSGSFWSILVDPPDHPDARRVIAGVSENGLISSLHDAASYLEAYRSRWLDDQDVIIWIWEVHLVK
jgi:hypothetical protein